MDDVNDDSLLPVIIETIQKNFRVLLYNYTLSLDNTSGEEDPRNEEDNDAEDIISNNVTGPWGNGSGPMYTVPRLSAEIQIVLYALIFLLAVLGNLLVIITLFQNLSLIHI